MLPLQRQNAIIIVTHGRKHWLNNIQCNKQNEQNRLQYCKHFTTIYSSIRCPGKISIVLIWNAFYNYSTTNTTTELLQIIKTIMEQVFILNIVNVIYLYVF